MDGTFSALPIFQPPSGMGGELMTRMEALMEEHEEIAECQPPFPFYTMSNMNQQGYGVDRFDDEEEYEGATGDQKKEHSYQDFERKLAEGILDCPNLSLHQVPLSIFDNKPSLSIIYLKDNQIHELPDYFFDELPCLSWLDLRDNKLTGLPGLSARHEALKVILLQGNRIRSLPNTLALGENLTTIALTGNPIIDPPEVERQKGCKPMLAYLREKMLMRVPMDEVGEYKFLPSQPEEEEELRRDLKKTASKGVSSTLSVQPSATSINSKKVEEKKIERLKYTWDLWKSIPYEGPSRGELYQKSLEESRTEVLAKLNNQQQAILQKIKDTDALGNWRNETKMMQYVERPPNDFCPVANAPFGNQFNQINKPKLKSLNLDEFQKEMVDCWGKLNNFASSPAPISNTKLALDRLREVEDIQQRLMRIRLKVKTGPTPL